jgi:tryptophan-rich sensory protein
MKKINFTRLLVSIIICEVAGAAGSFFTLPAIKTWYAGLNKPGFNPPSWIFAPVWTTLFLLMGVSLYLVWQKNFTAEKPYSGKIKVWNKLSEKFLARWQKANAVLVFSVQLGLNILWSSIFFGLHQPGVAFFELLMLWFAILYAIINFYRISKPAGYLLVPYILWVSFAALLNFNIWILNI